MQRSAAEQAACNERMGVVQARSEERSVVCEHVNKMACFQSGTRFTDLIAEDPGVSRQDSVLFAFPELNPPGCSSVVHARQSIKKVRKLQSAG